LPLSPCLRNFVSNFLYFYLLLSLYQTAFIAIPEDVSHGQALKCSHPICQKRGVRFRYCEVCQTPVAKRNFSTRHNHPPGEFPETKVLEARAQEEEDALETKTKVDLEKEEEGDAAVSLEDSPTPSSKRRCSIASLIAAAATHNQTAANTNISVIDTKVTSEVSSTTNDEYEEKHQKNSEMNNILMGRIYQTPMDTGDLAKFGSQRRMEWLTLLGQRPPPDRPDDMSAWLHQLMVVSDLSCPLNVADQDTMSDMAEEASRDGTARSTSSGDGS
jgi:hypothetical protein